jgi:uncharacterized protein
VAAASLDKIMFDWLKKKPTEIAASKVRSSFFSTHKFDLGESLTGFGDYLSKLIIDLPRGKIEGAADDSSNGVPDMKTINTAPFGIPEVLANWYASQTFIGHQLCAILSQHWLINKACTMPARDAVRKGFNIVSIGGDDLDSEAVKLMQYYDRVFKLNLNMQEFIRMGRIFGVRVAMFKVNSTDPEYYSKPFNPDGIQPKSYKGIVQIDPYWCAPQLNGKDASEPDSIHFYEPTYWIINGKQVHRSHLVIFRNSPPPDILKPQYIYGGVPVPQQIMERVYAAERVANEAPQLVQTKRTNIWLTDLERVMANSDTAIAALNNWQYYRDNYGIKLGDKDGDEFQQFDTSLGDLDTVIMTQYQIVAAAAGVPATKLLGTTPKGFNATGEHETASYHEELESIQANDLTDFVERHHLCVMRSYVSPQLGIEPVDTYVQWNPLDTPTAKEQADTNLVKAQTGAMLVQSGAISGEDERERISMDKFSGYHTLGIDEVEPDGDDDAY